MTNDEKSSIRDGLQQLAKRAVQNLIAQGTDRLTHEPTEIRALVLSEMVRLAVSE